MDELTADMTAKVTIAHPSADVYGSDRQLLVSIEGLVAAGRRVTVCLPEPGPLDDLLRQAGAEVRHETFPVIRRAVLNPAALIHYAWAFVRDARRIVRMLRRTRPAVVYVNTVTIPVWLVAARLARVPVLCHVHEAEERWPRLVRLGLAAPLRLAHRVVVNSRASARALTDVLPSVNSRIEIVYNGLSGPSGVLPGPTPGRVALVARLSPRKGVDVALEAVALLRGEGRDVCLDVCGSTFAGYEWFEEQLRERASRPDLVGAVRFLGYVSPTWSVLAAASVVVVPSRVEPFGNTAVEGLLAQRPVVASAVQGLAEIVRDGETGLLVPPGDAVALAGALGRVLDDPVWAGELAQAGREDAERRFSVQRYRDDITAAVTATRAATATS